MVLDEIFINFQKSKAIICTLIILLGEFDMKKYILNTLVAGLVLSSTPSFAELIPANTYNCTGQNISVNYSSTSFTGQAQITIGIGKQNFSGTGESIALAQTAVGNLITITKRAVPDAYTDTLSVVLPDVNVKNLGAKVKFNAQLISTHALTSIGGSALVTGVIQKNTTYPLTCTATAVVF